MLMTRRFDASPERLVDAWTDLASVMPQVSTGHDRITMTSEADSAGCVMRFCREGLAQDVCDPSETVWILVFLSLAGRLAPIAE